MNKFLLVLAVLFVRVACSGDIFIKMDDSQNNHLKAYGVVYRALRNGTKVDWLLGYMGGSFIVESDEAADDAMRHGVKFESIDAGRRESIINSLSDGDYKNVVLEKAPKIAVYCPPGNEPWDDAVTLVLEYTEIPYDKIYDREILSGKLYEYEWLHLHHEDFTGQFDRFYINSSREQWFIDMYNDAVQNSMNLGYSKYWLVKRDVAKAVSEYVRRGGFLFSMCSGTNSIDLAMALGRQDIIPKVLDGDGTENYTLDYTNTFAFEDFSLNENLTMDLDDINYEPQNRLEWEMMNFELKRFSPKHDMVEAMLTQDHVKFIKEFLGRTTSFRKDKIKDGVSILADAADSRYAKYIHGIYGEGFFTFLAGHDPEDYVHYVNDPPTDLSLTPRSPGYRLILNNILFPASREQKKKT